MPYGVKESPSRINCADMQLAVERGAIEGVDRPRTLSSGTHVAKRLPKSIHMTDGVPNATVFARRADMKFAIGLGTADVNERKGAAGSQAGVRESRPWPSRARSVPYRPPRRTGSRDDVE